MNKKIIANEFKSSLTTFIISTVILCLFLVVLIFLYPIYYNNKDSFYTSLNGLNKYLLLILNIKPEVLHNTSGYYAFIMNYILIIGALMACIISSKSILNDKINGFNEFLFTHPISRKNIFYNKIFSILLEIILSNIIFNILSFILVNIFFKKGDLNNFELFQINSALLLIEITFASITMMITSFFKNPKRTLPVCFIIVSIFYLVSIIERLCDFSLIRYINPFSYFKVDDIVIDGSYKYSFIIATSFIVLFSLNITLLEYEDFDVK